MSIIVFTILLLLGAYCAGLLGSLTGLGGGVIVIPLLTLVSVSISIMLLEQL